MSLTTPASAMTKAARFTWVPIYSEIADLLVDYEARQGELIELLEQVRSSGYKVTPLTDKDKDGTRFLIRELDPFTFFGTFNRGLTNEQRIGILRGVKEHLGAKADLPADFDGVPLLSNLSSWFISYQKQREPDAVARLWHAFRLALGDDPLNDHDFLAAFDNAVGVRRVNINLTMGLFWMRPHTFLNLDRLNRNFLRVKLPPAGLNADFYKGTVEAVRAKGKSFVELSSQAFMAAQADDEPPEQSGTRYWLVGAYWDSHDPPDQTDRFISDSVWENGYKDRYLDEVKSIQVGDRIAIKATATQKHGLPFDARGNTVSKMTIKAVGTVVANRGDGRTVEVEWESGYEPRAWYFYTDRSTVWRPRLEDERAKALIDFVFKDAEQDYEWFCRNLWGSPVETEKPSQAYSIDDIISSGAFFEKPQLQQAIDRLHSKKNLILQGAPGVGKTYLARKIAYALMEEKDDNRVGFVQFHQSFSYEDFLRGYRPLPESGRFGLQDGVFYRFCQEAGGDPDRPYVFIIDEINRGNLSQIFGEALMLLEADKRGPEHAVQLAYRNDGEARFFIPNNLHLIGMMNLADRSLALIDYALRRRFAFVTLRAQYASPRFKNWLVEREMRQWLVDLIVRRMTWLNQEIINDPLLGENYEVGHSFFCPKGEAFSGLDRNWYLGVVETEIVPLLREYWFDNQPRVDEVHRQLILS